MKFKPGDIIKFKNISKTYYVSNPSLNLSDKGIILEVEKDKNKKSCETNLYIVYYKIFWFKIKKIAFAIERSDYYLDTAK